MKFRYYVYSLLLGSLISLIAFVFWIYIDASSRSIDAGLIAIIFAILILDMFRRETEEKKK